MIRSTTLCLVLLVAVILAPVTGGIAVNNASIQDSANNSSSNTSVQHRNPSGVGEAGDLASVRRWLTGELTNRLGDGANQLSQSQYEQASQWLGEPYSKQLRNLVDVAASTNTSRAFRETRENQRETTNAVKNYRDKYKEYQEARQNGNSGRARQLARELQRLESRISRNANATVNGYNRLKNQTDADLSIAGAAVSNVSENISETQETIRSNLFVETTLTVTADGVQVSFVNPLEIRGQLRTKNGSVVANERISIRVGNRTIGVVTDSEGEFSISYRPVTLSRASTELRIEYVPRSDSIYLSDVSALPVDVESVTPTVTVERSPSVVRFNQTLRVSGRVFAEDEGVPAPVILIVGEERIGRTKASDGGNYTIETRLPATVGAGQQPVRVVVPLERRAIERTAATSIITIEETDTNLSADGSQVAGRTVQLHGQLTTNSGQGISGQSVFIALDDTALGSGQTNKTGWYRIRVQVPEAISINESIELNATFIGGATNLRTSSATTTVRLRPVAVTSSGSGQQPVVEWIRSNQIPVGVFLLGVLLLVGAATYGVLSGRWFYRSDTSGGSATDGQEAATPSEENSDVQKGTGTEAPTNLGALVEHARQQIANGATDVAVVTIYTMLRHTLNTHISNQPARTHWEFYHDASRVLGASEADALRHLTEAYERAAFAPSNLPVDQAREVLTLALSFGDDDNQSAD